MSVAITAMLVMYTLNTTISAKLPDSSIIKLMDIWILYGLFTHFLIVIILVLIEHLPSKPAFVRIEDCTSQIVQKAQKEKSLKDTIHVFSRRVLPILDIIFRFCYFSFAYLIYASDQY